MGNSGARSSGPTGSRVAGCSGGCSGAGRWGTTLNQASGTRSEGSVQRNGPAVLSAMPRSYSPAAPPSTRFGAHHAHEADALSGRAAQVVGQTQLFFGADLAGPGLTPELQPAF